MRYLAGLAVFFGLAAGVWANDNPVAALVPGTYLLVYRDSTTGSPMQSVKLTVAEQKDKGLTVQSEKVENLDPPAVASPVTQRDGRFTFTLVYTFPEGNPYLGGRVTGTAVVLQTRSFVGWADFTYDQTTNEKKVMPGVFRGSMSNVGEAGSFLGDFLLYRLAEK